jgi:hypothetical protein
MFLATQTPWTRTSWYCEADKEVIKLSSILHRAFLRTRLYHTLFSFQRSGEALHGLFGAVRGTLSMLFLVPPGVLLIPLVGGAN